MSWAEFRPSSEQHLLLVASLTDPTCCSELISYCVTLAYEDEQVATAHKVIQEIIRKLSHITVLTNIEKSEKQNKR